MLNGPYHHAQADLHMHTSCSDGTDSPEELYEKIEQLGIEVFAVCDHDTIAATPVLDAIRKADSSPDAPRFISGVELSCFDMLGKSHILGLGYDPSSPELLAAVAELAEKRKQKLQYRLGYLEETHGIVFDGELVAEWHSRSSVGRPHLARAIVEMGLAEDKDDAFERFLKGIPAPNTRMYAERAINAIHAAGGIAIWAHPLGGVGEKSLAPDVFADRLERLIGEGIDGLECYYSLYGSAKQQYLLEHCTDKGLLVSGGSDYHGANKTVKLGELASGDARLPEPGDLSVLDAL